MRSGEGEMMVQSLDCVTTVCTSSLYTGCGFRLHLDDEAWNLGLMFGSLPQLQTKRHISLSLVMESTIIILRYLDVEKGAS